MSNASKTEKWTHAYRALAGRIVEQQVESMRNEFPDERFPVRPAYRKAMYHRLVTIVDELNQKLEELLQESPGECDAALAPELMALQESYEQAFIREVRKEDPHKIIQA